MSTSAIFALLMGGVLLFIVGLLTGAALATLGMSKRGERRIGASYKPEQPVKTKVRGGGIEEDTRH
jgi:hypothetical protein